jgi:hypothetical protein
VFKEKRKIEKNYLYLANFFFPTSITKYPITFEEKLFHFFFPSVLRIFLGMEKRKKTSLRHIFLSYSFFCVGKYLILFTDRILCNE